MIPNLFLLAVSIFVIGLTVVERLNAPAAPAILVMMSMVSVFGIAIATSNIRWELKKRLRKG